MNPYKHRFQNMLAMLQAKIDYLQKAPENYLFWVTKIFRSSFWEELEGKLLTQG